MLGNYNTAQETADKLGIKKVTVLQYLKLGYLEGEMFGTQWAIKEKEVQRRKQLMDIKAGNKPTCPTCNTEYRLIKYKNGDTWTACDCNPF